MSVGFSNVNELWCSVIVETLRLKGVSYAITCPGSRSSPLTFAFARNKEIEAIPVLDERSAGFFALGLAKRTGCPVALVCTSGSAVANFFPAIVEASELGLPLFVMTADRPPELRDCMAGQTIDQVKLFGGYVRHQAEMAVPENSLGMLRYLREAISHAVDRAASPSRGPVHINLPFRDPLIPVSDGPFESSLSGDAYPAFFSDLKRTSPVLYASPEIPDEWTAADDGLIVVGACSPVENEAWSRNLSKLANSLGWPVLADALCPARSRSSEFKSLISGYDFIIRNREIAQSLKPSRVLVVGSFPTSKVLRSWLENYDLPLCVVSDRALNADPTHSRGTLVLANLEYQEVRVAAREPSDYTKRWVELDGQVERMLSERMYDTHALFEGKLSWTLSNELQEGCSLCVSNSMPPRDLEFYFLKRDTGISVFSSRGANGIDGILSTALGVSHRGGQTYLLTGDLALLHDTNGALITKQLEGGLTILLVNNDGGGIFQLLPVSQFEDVFEKHFATDQGIDFSSWAKVYGISHYVVKSWDHLSELLPWEGKGVRLLELRTSRKSDVDTRKAWFREISGELR